MKEKEDRLIKKCKQGDPLAQTSLYHLHSRKWLLLSMRYSSNRDEANDILQEGLVQIFKDIRSYTETKSSFTTWSSRVLVHAAIKYLKKTRAQNTFKDLETVSQIADPSDDIYEQLGEKELVSIISKLPPGYRVVFNMYAIEGYNHKEIARHLGISEGTSKSQLFKARKLLRKALEGILT